MVFQYEEVDEDGNRVREVRYQLIMPPLAVTELHRGLTGALEHLAQAGVVSKNQAGSETPEELPEVL